MQFSVLMSVYKNEKTEYFKQAIDSVIHQTMPPTEIVLVRDGMVYDELQEAINQYLEAYPNLFTYIPLEENGGLGKALRTGLLQCKYDLVARMDTDDICVSDRFEKQLAVFANNPMVDMVGGNIAEFAESIEVILDYRCVPYTDEAIKERVKSRSPFNHMTVMFKKEAVLKAGNYEPFYLFEDWYLWIRMFLSGCTFGNLNEVLVYARICGMSARRGGMKYFKSCKKLLQFMRQNGIISRVEYLKSGFIRFNGYVVCPNKVRELAYKKLLRGKNVQETESVSTATVEKEKRYIEK